jgi:hypothetical protein
MKKCEGYQQDLAFTSSARKPYDYMGPPLRMLLYVMQMMYQTLYGSENFKLKTIVSYTRKVQNPRESDGAYLKESVRSSIEFLDSKLCDAWKKASWSYNLLPDAVRESIEMYWSYLCHVCYTLRYMAMHIQNDYKAAILWSNEIGDKSIDGFKDLPPCKQEEYRLKIMSDTEISQFGKGMAKCFLFSKRAFNRAYYALETLEHDTSAYWFAAHVLYSCTKSYLSELFCLELESYYENPSDDLRPFENTSSNVVTLYKISEFLQDLNKSKSIVGLPIVF